MEKPTDHLYTELRETKDIYDYLKKNDDLLMQHSFHEYVGNLIRAKGYKKKNIIPKLNISRSHAYDILSGTKAPSRNKVLEIAFAICANIHEVNRMLNYAEHQSLYPKDIRDSIIIYAIENQFSVTKANELLYDMEVALID